MNLPTNAVITGNDKPEILEQAFQAAKTFKPLSEARFDGTAHHPDWLGGDDPAVQKLAPQPAG